MFSQAHQATHRKQVADKVHQAQREANEGGCEGCKGEELDQGPNNWIAPGQEVERVLGSSRAHDVLQQARLVTEGVVKTLLHQPKANNMLKHESPWRCDIFAKRWQKSYTCAEV